MVDFVTTPMERMPGTLITLPKPHPRFPESRRLFCGEPVEVVRKELERRGVPADIEISSLPYMEPELLFGKRIDGADGRALRALMRDRAQWFYSTVSVAPCATRLSSEDVVDLLTETEFRLRMEPMTRVVLDQLFLIVYEMTPLSPRMSLARVAIGAPFTFLPEGSLARAAERDAFDYWDNPHFQMRILARLLNDPAPFLRIWKLVAKKRSDRWHLDYQLQSRSDRVVLTVAEYGPESEGPARGYSPDLRVLLIQKS